MNAWIFGLLSLSEGVKVEDDDVAMQDQIPTPPPASSSSANPPPPDYTQGPPPGPIPGYPPSNAASGAPSIPTNLISLSFVHETATKRRVSIDYSAHKEGAAHTPSWTVRCISSCLLYMLSWKSDALTFSLSGRSRARTWYLKQAEDCQRRGRSQCFRCNGLGLRAASMTV